MPLPNTGNERQEILDLKYEIIELRKEIAIKEETIEALEEELEVSESSLCNSEDRVDELNQIVEEQEIEIRELKAKLHDAKAVAKEKDKEHDLERLELQNTIDELQDKLQEANDDYVNLLEVHTDLIGRFDNEKE
jgi:hypothetical protein|nr:MAG TPA: hypothetical protein [Caudoviricetes sp.]DAS11412.1 MAG TPA: hypothetical protein [Caudoviricetes sp.]